MVCHPGGKRETCHFFLVTLSKVKNHNFRGDVCWDSCLHKGLLGAEKLLSTGIKELAELWLLRIPLLHAEDRSFLLKATLCQENYPELLTSVSGMWGWSDAADILTPAASTVSTVSGNSRRSWRGAGRGAPSAAGWAWRWPRLRWLPSAGFAHVLLSRFFLAFSLLCLSQRIRIIVTAESEWEKKKWKGKINKNNFFSPPLSGQVC